MKKNEALRIGGGSVLPGTRRSIELPIARLVTGTPTTMPVVVMHGKEPGPSVWLNAAIHGDEINGVEIIRQVLEQIDPRTIRGTLYAIPIVNVYGFVNRDRYLPDRRDLNRSFPGSARGPLARRIAHLLMSEIVSRCIYGIDLHTGSDHRTNLPQIRANLDDAETRALASAFNAPLMMHSSNRDGSLRQAASDAGARVLLFEGGEASRFDPFALRVGVRGVLRVLSEVKMIDAQDEAPALSPESRKSKWIRAGKSGLLHLEVEPGDVVKKGQIIGRIHNALGERLSTPRSSLDGLVIGLTLDPLVNSGDAIVHVASVS